MGVIIGKPTWTILVMVHNLWTYKNISGLDLLKRHQCQIDLLNNKLIIGTTKSSTPFLSESELPKHARLTQE